jgi:membrane protein required for colicin V production
MRPRKGLPSTMTGADWVIIGVVFLSMLLAASQGFLFEVFSLAGVVLGYLLAAWEYQRVASWFLAYAKAAWMAEIAAFLVLFLAVVLVAGVVGRITRWAVKEVGLRWFDRLLGAAFGLLRGVLVVSVLVLAVASFTPDSRFLADSRLGPYLLVLARGASWAAPPAVRARFRQGVETLRNFSRSRDRSQYFAGSASQQR